MSRKRVQERVAKWPPKRRHWSICSDLTFDEANDHNPIVLDECPRCRGGGCHDEMGRDEKGRAYVGRVQCEHCHGTGTTGERVRYFDKDLPIVEVRLQNGWMKCPCCGWSFDITDTRVWTGLRHVRCGQRIRPVEGDVCPS